MSEPKILMYGSSLCPDCPPAQELLESKGVRYAYLDITSNLLYLKMFLKLRENSPEFNKIKENGQLGVPCLVIEDKLYFEMNHPDVEKLFKS